MTDTKVRPAEDVVTAVVRSWNEANYHNVSQAHARTLIEADRAAVTAQARGEVVREIAEWLWVDESHNEDEAKLCRTYSHAIRARFGGGDGRPER